MVIIVMEKVTMKETMIFLLTLFRVLSIMTAIILAFAKSKNSYRKISALNTEKSNGYFCV